MDVSVVLCTYNRAAQLRKTLESLAQQEVAEDLDWELIVVDNNSTDHTAAVVEQFRQQQHSVNIQYLFEAAQGKSYALNAGIRHARGRYLAFTDDDVVVDKNWVLAIRAAFRDLGCTVIAGRVRALWEHAKPRWLSQAKGKRFAAAIVEYEQGDRPFRLEIGQAGIGANMAVELGVFHRQGLFRTDIGPTAKTDRKAGSGLRCEDSEIFERVIRAGEPVFYAPDVVVDHPVEEFRATKRYFLNYYFANGRSRVRIQGVDDVPDVIGVPRYMIRQAIGKFFDWQLTLAPHYRFHRKLHFYEWLGAMYESRLINCEGKMGTTR